MLVFLVATAGHEFNYPATFNCKGNALEILEDVGLREKKQIDVAYTQVIPNI